MDKIEIDIEMSAISVNKKFLILTKIFILTYKICIYLGAFELL